MNFAGSIPMPPEPQEASITPRTDAAERFFHEPGRQPIGFVASGVARVLEVELSRALNQLHTHGVEAPQPLDARTHALLQTLRRPTAYIFHAPAQTPSPGSPVIQPSNSKIKLLPAAPATESLGETRSFDDGDVLYRRGERSENIYILLYGELRVSQMEDGSADRPASVGQVFGDHALFEDGLHTETLQAVGQAQCVVLPVAPLREALSADPSLLHPVMMMLVLQYRMMATIVGRLAAGVAPPRYELLGQKTLTPTELQTALVEARAQPGQGVLFAGQLMCMQLQTSDHLPTKLLRACMTLGKPGEDEHLGLGVLLVNGKAQARIGEHLVQLGQGAVVGVAEGLTGKSYGWHFSTMQDINARVFPIDRALQRLDRIDSVLRGLASHLCAFILSGQRLTA